jgi:hypothetical protein
VAQVAATLLERTLAYYVGGRHGADLVAHVMQCRRTSTDPRIVSRLTRMSRVPSRSMHFCFLVLLSENKVFGSGALFSVAVESSHVTTLVSLEVTHHWSVTSASFS